MKSQNALTFRKVNNEAVAQSKSFNPIERYSECCVCLSVMHNAVCVTPCLHSFCAGCVCAWMTTKHYCPMCRVNVTDVLVDRRSREFAAELLKQKPEACRSVEELNELDAHEQRYFFKWLVRHDPWDLSFVSLAATDINMYTDMNAVNNVGERRYKEIFDRVNELAKAFHTRNGTIDKMIPLQKLIEDSRDETSFAGKGRKLLAIQTALSNVCRTYERNGNFRTIRNVNSRLVADIRRLNLELRRTDIPVAMIEDEAEDESEDDSFLVGIDQPNNGQPFQFLRNFQVVVRDAVIPVPQQPVAPVVPGAPVAEVAPGAPVAPIAAVAPGAPVAAVSPGAPGAPTAPVALPPNRASPRARRQLRPRTSQHGTPYPQRNVRRDESNANQEAGLRRSARIAGRPLNR